VTDSGKTSKTSRLHGAKARLSGLNAGTPVVSASPHADATQKEGSVKGKRGRDDEEVIPAEMTGEEVFTRSTDRLNLVDQPLRVLPGALDL